MISDFPEISYLYKCKFFKKVISKPTQPLTDKMSIKPQIHKAAF